MHLFKNVRAIKNLKAQQILGELKEIQIFLDRHRTNTNLWIILINLIVNSEVFNILDYLAN